MSAEYTTGSRTSVVAREELRMNDLEKSLAFDGRPVVEVTFPTATGGQVTIFRPFANYEDAKAGARAIAAEINRLAPKGFRLTIDEPTRSEVEKFVRQWAGTEVIVD